MSAADALDLPPGVRFVPTPEELVEFYLMPRALGQPTAVPGIIIDDAEATTSSLHPWTLLKRNRRTDDDEVYFFEHIASGGGGASRQDRSCGGGRWTWVGQKRFPDQVLPLRGEQVSWGKYSLNLQEGRCKGGSTGWVMHEYTTAAPQWPPCPVKLCHVAFTGHGQKRQRVPDGDDCEGEGEGEGEELEAGTPQHKRVATASTTPASSVKTTATPDHASRRRARRIKNSRSRTTKTSSLVGNFWGSDAGFSQEPSITILDPWYHDPGTSHQEPFVLDQKVAQNQEYFSTQPQAYHHQEQFVNQGAPSAEAFCAMLLASGLGSSQSQEPPSGQPLTKEEQLRLQLDQLFGGISMPHCASVEHPESCTMEQSQGDMHDLPEFFRGWSDLDTFTHTSGVQDYGDGIAA